MFKTPSHYPEKALKRLPRQAARVAWPYSCQQDIVVITPSNAQISTWMTGPPTHPYLSILVQDHNRILPFTTLEFTVTANSVGPNTPEAFECACGVDTGDSNLQVRDKLITQINEYAVTFGQRFPEMRSLSAVIGPTLHPSEYSLIIRMPWGMLGGASLTYTGPISGSALPGFPGVDNPLAYGLIGKRRHVFGVRDVNRHAYYGPVPPT
jgi:hypothetical protein